MLDSLRGDAGILRAAVPAAGSVSQRNQRLSRGALIRSGLSVGRSVLGTMTTTLMLAYSGNYLSMLMYFVGQGTPVTDILNLKYVSSQLLNTLVGSFGLVAAAPLTAVIASAFVGRGRAGTARPAQDRQSAG